MPCVRVCVCVPLCVFVSWESWKERLVQLLARQGVSARQTIAVNVRMSDIYD